MAGVRLLVDGARPLLVIARNAQDTDPIAHLVRGEAAYLRADPEADPELVVETVEQVAAAGVAEHGAFLLIELWAGDRYRVLGPDGPAPATVRTLADGLGTLQRSPTAEPVEVEGTDERHPPGLGPLMHVSKLHELGALLIGVELPETWRDEESGKLYPVFLRHFAHAVSSVLRNAMFEFLRVQTGTTLPSYRALGRRSLGDAVWEADRRLAEISAAFDPLLLVAPVNQRAAWERFREGLPQSAGSSLPPAPRGAGPAEAGAVSDPVGGRGRPGGLEAPAGQAGGAGQAAQPGLGAELAGVPAQRHPAVRPGGSVAAGPGGGDPGRGPAAGAGAGVRAGGGGEFAARAERSSTTTGRSIRPSDPRSRSGPTWWGSWSPPAGSSSGGPVAGARSGGCAAPARGGDPRADVRERRRPALPSAVHRLRRLR
jgi:hypothetical protein